MDSDISSYLPDIMMMASDHDIPDIADVLDAVWIAKTFSLTLPKEIINTRLYIIHMP